MLSAEDNAYLTQVRAAEPMGKLLRCYWHPILLSSELPEPDGKPVKVRALGEDLVAFRNSEGKIGLLGALCPHKSAPLYFGRNEDCGLRCVYHGWKFDLEGNCLDMPNVPLESNYKDKIQQTAYPVVEANGFIFAYMGPGEPPPMPDLGFLNVPQEHIYVTKQKLECNWVQAMEGDFDPSHIGFLHSSTASHFEDEDDMDLSVQISAGVSVRSTVEDWKEKEKLGRKDRRPLILVVNTEYGLLLGGRRDPGPSVDEYYWRMNQLIMPFYAFVPGVVGAPNHCNAWVPMDERTTMVYRIQYLRERPFNEAEKVELGNGKGAHVKVGGYLPPTAEPGSAWIPADNRDNDYGWTLEAQRHTYYAGIEGVWKQDRAATEGMGAVVDRTRENLGPSDVGTIQMRRTLMAAAKAVAERDATPPGLISNPPIIDPIVRFIPKSTPWEEIVQEIHGMPYENVVFRI